MAVSALCAATALTSPMSSPSHVVSTLNRYVFLDSPHVAFLHRIALQQGQADHSSTATLSIRLTFTFQHGKHSVFLRLHPTSSSAAASTPSLSSTVSLEGEWQIGSIAATHHDLVSDLNHPAQLCSDEPFTPAHSVPSVCCACAAHR